MLALPLYSQSIEGSRSFSMSGAFSAIGSTNDALFINAAGMSLYPNRYNIDIAHNFRNRNGFNVSSISILDTTNFPLGAGFSFAYMWGEEYEIEKQGYRLDLGFSYPFMQKLLWGVDVKYIKIDVDRRENAINAATVDTGFLIPLTRWARVSVFGQNLIYIGRDELPIKVGGGAMVGSESHLLFAEDTVLTFLKNGERKITQSVATSLFLWEIFSITVGYKYDQIGIHNHYISGGVGLFSRAAGVEVGYRQAIEEREDFQILASIKFFME